MIVVIIGSRTRNSTLDIRKLRDKILELEPDKIITGDCERGADKLARDLALELGIELQVFAKKEEIQYDEFGERLEIDYITFTKLCYARNKLIGESEMDYFVVMPHLNKGITGGTRNTVNYFKQYHKDWKEKLIKIV